MSKDYKFTFKKDDIFVEFDTTDREALARQFQIWVTCASVYTYQQQRLKEEIQPSQTQIKNEEVKATPSQMTPVQVELQPEPYVLPIEQVVQPKEEKVEEPRVTLNDLQNNQKADIEEFKSSEESLTLEEKKQEIAKTVEHVGEIGSYLDSLYNIEGTAVNTLEIFKEKIEEEGDFSNKSADFDKILELSMNAVPETETEIKKDDRFLKILNVKNVSSKLEYLIVTAYYLSEFEKLDKFTLKLINAKLMQNIKEAVDHNVLQEAIDNGLVEVLPSLPNIANSVEYRLTNAGEEAFLNGTKL